jgi:hypothetical protein
MMKLVIPANAGIQAATALDTVGLDTPGIPLRGGRRRTSEACSAPLLDSGSGPE